jgi:endonuclease/exonuclease/phosphatase family metal-dependent hydrolase
MQFQNRFGVKNAGRMQIVALLTIGLLMAWSLTATSAHNNKSIKVMTQNMDAGTDLGFIFGLDDLVLGAQLTYQEITTSSMIEKRVQRLAAEIAAAKPDLIGLQEVTTWAIGTISNEGNPNINAVLYDQRALLLSALEALGEHYVLVDTQYLTMAGAPLLYDLSQFLFWQDSNVILKRSEVNTDNAQQDYFNNLFEYGGITELLGWMSVDVNIQGTWVRFFTTHLASTNPAIPAMAAIQVLQGIELVNILDLSLIPVALAGDFNSDASSLEIGPDLTSTAGNIEEAGYADVWKKLHLMDHGLTWPRYLEDILPIPTSQKLSSPAERIDLIFVKKLTPINIELTNRRNQPLASDHMGVMSTLRLDK